jgi:hypothetical protein
MRGKVALSLALHFAFSATVFAQFSQRNGFSGTVTDPSGGMMVGVPVTLGGAPQGGCTVLKKDDSMRSLLPPCWYQKAAALKITTLKKNMRYGQELSMDPDQFSRQVEEIKAEGFQVIEIFAPADGLRAYNGLDTKNFYRIDPELGTIDDFRRLVRIAHTKGIALVIFLNLGYVSVESPDWVEACGDKKAGKNTDKVKWFLWSDKQDAPWPPTQDDNYSSQAGRDREKDYWGWNHSDLAGSYYWARWKATAEDGSAIPLPEMNWSSEEWRSEAERIVRFWMDTGIDGMLVDSPTSYPYQTWEHNRRYITSVIASYGNVFIEPEGGKGTGWITEGGYNAIHNYGLSYIPDTYQSQRPDVITESVNSGNPRAIEMNLRAYRDRFAELGAVLYSRGFSARQNSGEPAKRHLQYAVLAGIGDLIVMGKDQGNPDAEESLLFHMKQLHPALHATASRVRLRTDSDDKYYAFMKTAQDGSERIVAVYNFQSSPQTVKVDLSVVDTPGLVDLRTSEVKKRPGNFAAPLALDLPGYGYRFYEVLPPVSSL